MGKIDSSLKSFPWYSFRRFVLSQASLCLISFLVLGVAIHIYFKDHFLDEVRSQMHDTTVAISGTVDRAKIEIWCGERARGTSLRVTVIRRDGNVLCDSHENHKNMENHLERPEVVEALAKGQGTSLRYSNTLKYGMLYLAVFEAKDNLFVRTATPTKHFEATFTTFDRWLFSIFSIAVLLMILSFVLTGRQIMLPMSRVLQKIQKIMHSFDKSGPLTQKAPDRFRDEWRTIETGFDFLQKNLDSNLETLNRQDLEQETILTAISDAILAIDKDETVKFFNSHFVNWSGIEQTANLTLESVLLSETAKAAFRHALASGLEGVQQNTINEIEIGGRSFNLSVSPLCRRDGELYGVVGVFHDQTILNHGERVRLDFVANASHELKTPLTSIKGFADTAMMEINAGRPVTRDLIEVICRNVSHLINLVHDLLDLSRLESSIELPRERVATELVTTQVVIRIQPLLDAKNQILKIEAGAKEIYASPHQLEQVVVNLLENSCKYTEEGSHISLNWLVSDKGVILTVCDNGPGIAKADLRRIFERFFRVDKTRSRHFRGTGLGLAIVKRIVESHGGKVWVESELGSGTKFYCLFPSAEV